MLNDAVTGFEFIADEAVNVGGNRCPQNDVGQAEIFPHIAVRRRTDAHTTAFL